MNKSPLIPGIVVLLISVGLSGCLNINYVHVNELVNNPNENIGKTLIVYAKYNAYASVIYDGYFTSYRLLLIVPEGVDDSMLIHAGDYYFKGVLRQSAPLTYFEVSEIFIENPSPTELTPCCSPCCLLSVFILGIVGVIFVAYRGKKKKQGDA